MAKGQYRQTKVDCKCGRKMHAASTECFKCKQEAKKKNKVSEKDKKKTCKVCQKVFFSYDKRKACCSSKCGHESRKKDKIPVNCVVCSKEIVLYKFRVREVNCCSLECQRKWALDTNRSCRLSQSERASRVELPILFWTGSKYSKKDRCDWCECLSQRLSKIRCASMEDVNSWEYKLKTRIQSNVGRVASGRHMPKTGYTNVFKQLTRIENKRRWFDSPEWDRKLVNKLSNMRKRRKRKEFVSERNNQKQNGCEADRQARNKWIQVCFDWLGDHA